MRDGLLVIGDLLGETPLSCGLTRLQPNGIMEAKKKGIRRKVSYGLWIIWTSRTHRLRRVRTSTPLEVDGLLLAGFPGCVGNVMPVRDRPRPQKLGRGHL